MEVRQVLLGCSNGCRLVGDSDVDHAVRLLNGHRPDLARFEHAQPSTFDHRRAAHPDVRVGRRDHHVATAEDCRVPGEAVAGVDADERHQGAEAGEVVERPAVEAAHTYPVGVAGPPSPAFGEEHHGEPHRLGQLEQPVLLAMILLTLGACKNRVVV